MENVVFLAVVRVEERLNMSPRALDRVCMSPSTLIEESDRVVDALGARCREEKNLHETEVTLREPHLIEMETEHREAGVFFRHRHL